VKVSEHLFPNAHVQKVIMKMKTKLVKNVVVNVLNVKNPHPTVLYVQKKELKDLNQNVLAQQVNMKRTENVSNVTTNVIHVYLMMKTVQNVHINTEDQPKIVHAKMDIMRLKMVNLNVKNVAKNVTLVKINLAIVRNALKQENQRVNQAAHAQINTMMMMVFVKNVTINVKNVNLKLNVILVKISENYQIVHDLMVGTMMEKIQNVLNVQLNALNVKTQNVLNVKKTDNKNHQNVHVTQEKLILKENVNLVNINVKPALNQRENVTNVLKTESINQSVNVQKVLMILKQLNVHHVRNNVKHV
jgi:hypothetical protein